MNQEQLYEAIGDMDEAFIREAHAQKSRRNWYKWGTLAACLALVVTAILFFPFAPDGEPIPPTDANAETSHLVEMATGGYSEAYLYSVDDGIFASYFGGKVIEEAKIGSKIQDVTLTAGWQTNEGDWLTTEHLRGELYLIEGISQEVAVALKFIDKGDALTTTHYYTLLNPKADLTEMQEYCIHIRFPSVSNAPQSTNDYIEIVTETTGEYVQGVTVTSQASE